MKDNGFTVAENRKDGGTLEHKSVKGPGAFCARLSPRFLASLWRSHQYNVATGSPVDGIRGLDLCSYRSYVTNVFHLEKDGAFGKSTRL